MSMLVYLDNASTTRPCTQALEAAREVMEERYYNPSSLYAQGYSLRKSIEDAREHFIGLLSCRELVFTSGGTEADNLAVFGLLGQRGPRKKVLFSAVEHAAVREACRALGPDFEALALPVTEEGLVDLEAAESLMGSDTAMLCVMQVNNETGAIQPLDGLISLRDKRCPDALLHVDGVQGFLHLRVTMGNGIDSYAFSAHKIHGLKGAGALALGGRARLKPRQFGGSQEKEFRPGTENTAGILAMLAAAKAFGDGHSISEMKSLFYQTVSAEVPEVTVNGPDPLSSKACSHILNLSFPPVKSQTLMHALEGAGVLVSQGSACSSRSRKPNPVLTAMGKSQALMDSALRFSFSRFTTKEEVLYAADACIREYKNLRRFTRR